MEILWQVPAKKGDASHPFTGSCVLKIPSAAERARIIKGIKYGPDATGQIVELDNLDSSINIIEVTKKHVISVDVTHVKSGKAFKSLEELECYQVGSDLMNELSEIILRGMPLGEA